MYKSIKYFLDTLFALLLLIGLSPLLLGIIFLLWIQNGGSPFFTQVRPGKNEQLFTIYKFKTMRDTRDAAGKLLPDFQRITPLGKLSLIHI